MPRTIASKQPTRLNRVARAMPTRRAVDGVIQIRYNTDLTVEDYVSRQAARSTSRVGASSDRTPSSSRWCERRGECVRLCLALLTTLLPDRCGRLEPTVEAFGAALGTAAVLVTLRSVVAAELAALPAPIGFSRRIGATKPAPVRAQHERLVKQELYAHFNLIAMARLFTNRDADRCQAGRQPDDQPAPKWSRRRKAATA